MLYVDMLYVDMLSLKNTQRFLVEAFMRTAYFFYPPQLTLSESV
jgi:hypothetical protein